MPRVALSGGDYQARNLIASAQRVVNLYPEPMPQAQGEAAQFTYYPTPGMALSAVLPAGPIRGLLTTAGGYNIVVAGNKVYQFTSGGLYNDLSIITHLSSSTGPVRLQDNGVVVVIVDGSANGWYLPAQIGQNPGQIVQISDPAFYGSVTIAVLDTFLVFASPADGSWYVSPSNYAGNSTPFDALYVARKATYPDWVQAITAASENLWILGQFSAEVWFTSGASDFPFSRVQGVALDNGCIAPLSVQTDSSNVFWLSRNLHGEGVVMQGSGTSAQRISTFAMETSLSAYTKLTDAIGAIYQLGGHTFYLLTFPSADKTWAYDVTVGLWHERVTLDANGNEHAYAATYITGVSSAALNARVICNGPNPNGLYGLDVRFWLDDQFPIKRVRTFQHLMEDGSRVRHNKFSLDIGATTTAYTINVSLSDDRGATFGPAIPLATGPSTLNWPTIWRLGMARDRVFQVQWTDPAPTAINGAFIDFEPLRS